MLGQSCLRALLGEPFLSSLKCVLWMGFSQCPEMGPKVHKKVGFSGRLKGPTESPDPAYYGAQTITHTFYY